MVLEEVRRNSLRWDVFSKENQQDLVSDHTQKGRKTKELRMTSNSSWNNWTDGGSQDPQEERGRCSPVSMKDLWHKKGRQATGQGLRLESDQALRTIG